MIGSLFTGYGGLDMAVESVLGVKPGWFVEYDKAPSKILEYHWPDVPNYGDVTTIDWALVPPIDVLTAGYPCQPFSVAGDRKGSNDERHLWPYVLDAIRYLRPRLAVLENVRGHLTLGFDAVLRDLAEAGYDTEWICLPASAAGAPHRRERIFIVAYPAGEPWRVGDRDDVPTGRAEVGCEPDAGRGVAEDTDRAVGDQRRFAASGQAEGGRSWSDAGGRGGAPSADAERDGGERRGAAGDVAGSARAGEGQGDQRQRDGDAAHDRWRTPGAWGPFAPAINRWERVTGRLAPAPTRPDGRMGGHRLSPEFVEWMMGLPAGHITDVDIKRDAQLKALGNGVVPQQAALAVSTLLGHTSLNVRQENR